MPQESHNLTAFHRLLALTAPAQHRLGGHAAAAAWLQSPNSALGGATPMSLLLTQEGAARVSDALQKT